MFICFTPLRDWLYSQSLFRMALLLHFSTCPLCPSSLHGGPLWGELAGSLNLYDETGVEHEKNVGRPRAAAVAAGGIIELSYFTLVRSSQTFARSESD
jgi:hypothetical protein|nr:MAG TPA: hypothetical protein [Microviridae sp.]